MQCIRKRLLVISFNEPIMFYSVLVYLGFIAGFFGSMLGLGGGWLIVPALQVFGIPSLTAVGTSLTAMIFTSSIGALRYYYKKVLLVSLGLLLAVPALGGVFLGKVTLSTLSHMGYSDLVLKIAFMLLLFSLGISMLLSSRIGTTVTEKKVRLWQPIGPFVQISDNRRVGLLNAAVVGIAAGFLSGLLGIGGGIVLTPALVGLFGFSVVQAASASLISVLLSSLLGSGLYWVEGHATLGLALTLSIGTSIGSLAGATYAPKIPEYFLKRIFALLTLLTGTALLVGAGDHAQMSVGILTAGSTVLFIATVTKIALSPSEK